MRIYYSIVTVLLMLTSSVLAKVGQISFDHLINDSQCIAIGKAISVDTIDNVKIAKIAIEQRIKAATSTDTIFVLAQPTWECDISEVQVGERCLFFLKNPVPLVQLTKTKDPIVQMPHCPFTQEELDKYFKRGTFFQITFDGMGRMPFRIHNHRKYVTLWTGNILLPDSIHTIPGPEKKYEFIRSAAYEGIMNYIDHHLRNNKQ